jgi:hypothetical protein
MKLEFPAIEIQKSANFKQANFDFGDKRIIMNILRSKMYSRPAYVICQEIMSNARDANREAGRGDKPIEITVPNDFSDQIVFKDCGPGITPERMENVFIRYGNSTKRSDNNQTGGFGLGAKTPFSYTDSFNITTITSENGKNTKRVYVAYIDESQLGAITLVSEAETSDETGTSISMAVRRNDNDEFLDSIRRVGHYWSPRPAISGSKYFTWQPIKYAVHGQGWALLDNYSADKGATAVILIDSIPYSVRQNGLFPSGHKIHHDKDYNLIKNLAASGFAVLNFPVGELAVTANREDLDYQPEVIEKIHERLRVMVTEARQMVSDKIKDAKNLWEATLTWSGAASLFSTFGIKPQWNNCELLGSSIDLYYLNDYDWNTKKTNFDGRKDCKVSVFEMDPNGEVKLARESRYRRRRTTSGGNPVRAIQVQKDWLVLMDEMNVEKTDRSRVVTVFAKNPGITKVAVVSFSTQAAQDWIEKKLNWSLMGFGNLSVYPKTPRARVQNKGGYKIYKVKKLISRSGRGGDTFDWVSDNTRTTADTNGGVYVILREGVVYLGPKLKVSKARLLEIKRFLNVEIHGFLYKWSKKDINPAWRPLLDVVKEEVNNIRSNPEFLHLLDHGIAGSAYDILPEAVVDEIKETAISDGDFKNWIVNSRKVRKATDKGWRLNTLLKFISQKDVDFQKGLLAWWRKRCLNRYPLLTNLNNSNASIGYAKKLLGYINLVDKEVKNV